MNRATPREFAFSLVEVVLAIGIIAFALLMVVALLPIGIKINKISAEETRAINLLSLLEADLRNTHPSANANKSHILGLALPYTTNASGGVTLNRTGLATNTLSVLYTVGLQENETPAPALTPSTRYQASVIYTRIPAADSGAPIEARLVINWPGTNTTNVRDLEKMAGFVESFVTFPAP